MISNSEELARLQASIAAIEAQRPVLGDAVVEPALTALREKLAALEIQAQHEPQRKLATVLFADVFGFTALSEMRDAEVVAGIMNDLWALVDRAVTDHGGRIDKHIGDAVMALWGTENAREDDAEQAVRAALAMQTAIDEFCKTHSAPLDIRVGINTGPVLLGRIGTTGEFTALGDTVNLASRIEHAAPVGGVLISHDTYRLIRGIFDVAIQEPIALKGKTNPVQTYIVLRAKPRAFRMATRGVEGIETRMIGREAEMGVLQEAYLDVVNAGRERAIIVIGEAGVGKSRLLYEFDNWIELRPEVVTYFKGRGTPNTQNVPYGVFRDLFAFRFDIRDSDSAAVALDKFQAGMAPFVEPDQAAIAGHWLGFDFSSSEAVQGLLGGSGFAETARAYLTRYFRLLLAGGPAMILLEDIHWADDPSLDLVIQLTGAVPTAPLLVVVVARPAFFESRPGWGEGEIPFQRIFLKPLSQRASRELVEEILQRVDDIPPSLEELIVVTAEGNPFYVEEVVKMLIEQGVIERVASEELRVTSDESGDSSLVTRHSSLERWHVRVDKLVDIRVPPTLTGLLQARLDGLPRPEQAILQRAAVVGRLFWDDAVAILAQATVTEIQPALAAVQQRELIFGREQSTFSQCNEYIFKHALLRDVAYETVLLKHRAELHGRVARWLEANAGERLGEYLSLIAEHYIQAGEELRAATLLEQSGYEAVAIGAWATARRALERALALRKAAGDVSSRAVTRATITLGWSLGWLGDYPAAEKALDRGRAAAHEAGDSALEAEALAQMAEFLSECGQPKRAAALSSAALQLAREANGASLPFVLVAGASTAWSAGDLNAAEALAGQALEAAQQGGDTTVELRALNILGIIAMDRRDLSRADDYFHTALTKARTGGNLSREAIALANLGVVANRRGDYHAAHHFAQITLERLQELGEQRNIPVSLILLAQANLKLGDTAAARRGARETLSLCQPLGMQPMVIWGIFLAGQILAAEAQNDQALALFGLARAHPATDSQALLEIDEEIAGMGLPPAQVTDGLAAGAALDLDAVVQEILDGKW